MNASWSKAICSNCNKFSCYARLKFTAARRRVCNLSYVYEICYHWRSAKVLVQTDPEYKNDKINIHEKINSVSTSIIIIIRSQQLAFLQCWFEQYFIPHYHHRKINLFHHNAQKILIVHVSNASIICLLHNKHFISSKHLYLKNINRSIISNYLIWLLYDLYNILSYLHVNSMTDYTFHCRVFNTRW